MGEWQLNIVTTNKKAQLKQKYRLNYYIEHFKRRCFKFVNDNYNSTIKRPFINAI